MATSSSQRKCAAILFDRAIKHMLSHIKSYYLQPAPLIGGQLQGFNCSESSGISEVLGSCLLKLLWQRITSEASL